MAKKKKEHTPVMKQFMASKEAYPDALLFFRLGDFYELFYDDAIRANELLGITLTARGKGPDGEKIPMAGVPHHAAAGYLARLLAQGQKVAICEQMADPKSVKGVVPRAVVRVATPGLCAEPDALNAREQNYLCAIKYGSKSIGFAAFDLSTNELLSAEVSDEAALLAELTRLDAKEILFGDEVNEKLQAALRPLLPHARIAAFAWDEEYDLLQHIGDEWLGGVAENEAAAIQVLLGYAQSCSPGKDILVGRRRELGGDIYLSLDEVAIRNLELIRSSMGERKGSLLHLLDKTCTAMGARLLRERILRPLCVKDAIETRLDAVSFFVQDLMRRDKVREVLREVADIERIATRAELGMASPREIGALKRSLNAACSLQEKLDGQSLTLEIGLDANALQQRLDLQVVDEPPAVISAGGVFLDGVDDELDELRALSKGSHGVLKTLEERERTTSGITSLKIKYNKVFGHYFEVTKSNLAQVPDYFRRKQTLANAERYTTDELDELGDKIVSADERARALEGKLFKALVADISAVAEKLRQLGHRIASIDVAAGLADVAERQGYCRPVLNESRALALDSARHPIVEKMMGEDFVPNDIFLDADGERLMVITGPNMAGKSTVMRQCALIVLMAQMGSYVPAATANIGLVDKIFTRVGASDHLSRGQSTFMVEMSECASILRGATDRSLVILDEVGRGTSTYDGLAIAWSVAEFLHDVSKSRAMFATHYHELCELAETRDGVFNRNVAAKEKGDEVSFLRTLMPGGASRSYGLAVATAAGVPSGVVARANAMLSKLEEGAALPSGGHARMRPIDADGGVQLELFAERPKPVPVENKRDPLRDTLAHLDPDSLSPRDALETIYQLRALASKTN